MTCVMNLYIQQGKNFTNKLWNALKLINGWEVDEKNLSQLK